MRYVIYGAGAIGGGIGGRLFRAGHDVVLICRGEHLEKVRRDGLLLCTPEGESRLRVPVAGSPREVRFTPDDVMLLTMKTQDTAAALEELLRCGAGDLPVVCAQNGVENERMALRKFSRVYAMLVYMPATFLTPGEVVVDGAPYTGVLHTGRYPRGIDEVAERVCEDMSSARMLAEPDAAVMRFKYSKLLTNLGNTVQVVTGITRFDGSGPVQNLLDAVRDEARACFAAAGIEAAPEEEYEQRVRRFCAPTPVPGRKRIGSSTVQSLLRGRTTLEVDYLNGEIALLGSLLGVATPYNRLLQRLANQTAANGIEPGHHSVDDLVRLVALEEQERGGAMPAVE